MSASQDSLSQSLLAPEVPQNQLGKAKELLDEIERKQTNIRNSLTQKQDEFTSQKICKSTLGNIKENLVAVNKILQNEKQIVSGLKESYSQSQSQADFAESQNLMKQSASALLTQQKRLLDAFKSQKYILDLLKEDEKRNHEHNQGKPATAVNSQQAPINIPNKNDTASKISGKATALPLQDQSCSFKVIDSKVQGRDDIASTNHHSDSITKTVMPGFLTNGNHLYLTSSQVKSSTKMIQSSQGMPCEAMDEDSVINIKTQVPSREQTKRRRQTPSKCSSSESPAKHNKSTKNGSVSHQILPFLNDVQPKPSLEELDISKMKFVVTLKDEEFLASSKFLPENFWTTKAFDNVCIDDDFLKKLGFF